MNVLEFCEAIARVAEKLSPASPAYKEKGLKLSQRRVLPLFVKLEGKKTINVRNDFHNVPSSGSEVNCDR
jgi:hypothetical protein